MYPYQIQHYGVPYYGVPYCKYYGVSIKQGVRYLKATFYNN